jgi:hypothetical protein
MVGPLLLLATLHFAADTPPLQVRVDARRHEIVLRLGPFALPAIPSMAGHEAMHHHAVELPVYRFALPVGGWLRGFRIVVQDEQGHRCRGDSCITSTCCISAAAN